MQLLIIADGGVVLHQTGEAFLLVLIIVATGIVAAIAAIFGLR